MPDPYHIVFVHGVADISKQWHRAKAFFESNGFDIHFYDYRTLENNLDIPAIVTGLTEFVQKNVGAAHYQIFAHSQGGLIAEWFDFFNGDPRLKRIVTIGTPFQGNTLPLIAPHSLLSRLPVGRKQIEDLACMSPILSSLIHKRLEHQENRTPFVTLISHSVKIFNIQSDGLVSVCAGNRNADYFLIEGDKIHSIPTPEPTPLFYVETNHLPLSIVRLLQPARLPNPFSTLLLTALKGETISLNDTFTPSQCAFVYPARIKDAVKFPDSLKKIISRPTQDGKYLIVYFNLRNTESHVAVSGQSIPIQSGKFTYLLDSVFLNTKT